MSLVCAVMYVHCSIEPAHLASEQLETEVPVAVNTPMVAIAEAPFGGIK